MPVKQGRHPVALHYMHYNFCRIYKTLRITPAMAARVTDRLCAVVDIVTCWKLGKHGKIEIGITASG
jgi:hypothetical protein